MVHRCAVGLEDSESTRVVGTAVRALEGHQVEWHARRRVVAIVASAIDPPPFVLFRDLQRLDLAVQHLPVVRVVVNRFLADGTGGNHA